MVSGLAEYAVLSRSVFSWIEVENEIQLGAGGICFLNPGLGRVDFLARILLEEQYIAI